MNATSSSLSSSEKITQKYLLGTINKKMSSREYHFSFFESKTLDVFLKLKPCHLHPVDCRGYNRLRERISHSFLMTSSSKIIAVASVVTTEDARCLARWPFTSTGAALRV